MKKEIKIPKFRNATNERRFWAKIDLSEYVGRKDFEPASFPNLKPSSRSVSIRIPVPMLLRLKERANELNVPYQSLIKEYVARELAQAQK